MKNAAKPAYYKSGVHATRVQGEEYTSPLYEPGMTKSVKKQGNLFSGSLFYSGGKKGETQGWPGALIGRTEGNV